MMKMKYTIAAMAVSTLVANAAITVTSASSSGSTLTVSISGTFDSIGVSSGSDIGDRNLLVFADKDLGGTQSTPQSQYGGLIGGEVLDHANHAVSGKIGSVTVGSQIAGQPSSNVIGNNNSYAVGIRGIDTSDNELIRGQGSNYDRIDYLAVGFGQQFRSQMNTTSTIDLTFSFELASEADASKYNTAEKFVADWGLFVQDGHSNSGLNAHGGNYNALTAVPEPSSAALLGLGGLALILRRRK